MDRWRSQKEHPDNNDNNNNNSNNNTHLPSVPPSYGVQEGGGGKWHEAGRGQGVVLLIVQGRACVTHDACGAGVGGTKQGQPVNAAPAAHPESRANKQPPTAGSHRDSTPILSYFGSPVTHRPQLRPNQAPMYPNPSILPLPVPNLSLGSPCAPARLKNMDEAYGKI
jgi:hypothetical protein